MADHPDKTSDMIELWMCSNDLVDSMDSPVPEKRSHHGTAHVESLIRRPSVDQHHLPIWQLNNRAIALPDVKECDTKVITIKKHP
jgi:hypothetical protein